MAWASSSSPTRNRRSTRRKFIQFCEELIAATCQKARAKKWGINTRVTGIMRDKELLPLYRRAGLVHVSLGTEAAAQLKLDRSTRRPRSRENKEAIRLLREADIFTEAQFIVGLDNETPRRWKKPTAWPGTGSPDLANWAMYTPWPFTPLFQELGDKVEIFDFSKYNLVTPIMRPPRWTAIELLRPGDEQLPRFYMKKALSTTVARHRLPAALPAGMSQGLHEGGLFARTFYDLGKVDYWGPQSKGKLNFNLDRTRTNRRRRRWRIAVDPGHRGAEACGAPVEDRRRGGVTGGTRPRPDAGFQDAPTSAEVRARRQRRAGRWAVKACGGGDQQMEDVDGIAPGSAAAAQDRIPAQ